MLVELAQGFLADRRNVHGQADLTVFVLFEHVFDYGLAVWWKFNIGEFLKSLLWALDVYEEGRVVPWVYDFLDLVL